MLYEIPMLFVFSILKKHKQYINFNDINSWWLKVSCEYFAAHRSAEITEECCVIQSSDCATAY